MRYTKRDECGNAHLIHEEQTENTARAFLNHVASLEDWFDALKGEGAIVPIRCKDCKHRQYDAMMDVYWCRGIAHSAEWYCADAEWEDNYGSDT